MNRKITGNDNMENRTCLDAAEPALAWVDIVAERWKCPDWTGGRVDGQRLEGIEGEGVYKHVKGEGTR